MKHRKIWALMLALVVTLGLSACGTPGGNQPGSANPGVEASGAPSTQPTDTAQAQPTPAGEETVVRLGVLSGPTGIGAAKLLADSDAGVTGNTYAYTIAADNNELMAGLTQGTVDIATVASNVAVNLYHKTGGDVRIIALGTKGVLHILEGSGGTEIQRVEQLRGQTIYAAGQGANPEFILRHLLQSNGLDPDKDVTIVFADASEITQKLMTGEAKVAMLPVPAATAAILKSEGKIRSAIDVTEAWEGLEDSGELMMTAVVARTQFIQEHPQAVAAFLEEYAQSIGYVNTNVEEAAQLVAGFGITPSAAIAKAAIPQCHLTFVSGQDMAGAVSDYFATLYQINPSALGGALPDDGIYYVP
ncbi:MAG TPA: ABC transporter substrate-binding protein [Clostridiales bacterium]|nr:ABC transporter substrate-binding protein [Clostridiales bacterium]